LKIGTRETFDDTGGSEALKKGYRRAKDGLVQSLLQAQVDSNPAKSVFNTKPMVIMKAISK
jgi:hypothetical protein